MEYGSVELRLGLGRPDDRAQGADPLEQLEGSARSHGELSRDRQAEQKKLGIAGDGVPSVPSLHSFWRHSFRLNLSSDHQQQPSNNQDEAGFLKSASTLWGQAGKVAMAGCSTIPIPKVSRVPAKRPYVDAVGEKGPSESAMAGITLVGGMYPWNGETLRMPDAVVNGGAWQHSVQRSYDQGAINVKSVGSPVLPATLPPPVAEASIIPDLDSEPNRCKAPVVGWPPVRAFRKNTLQAATGRLSSDDPLVKSMGGGDVSEQVNGNTSKNAFFVKVKLDGVRICRKVDLAAYDSYDGLISALQDMFQGFVSGNARLDLLHGSSHVVTHEDKDGDCLLVGDVPWNMFVTSSVKSLRIMKAMDAGDKESGKP